MPCLQENLAPWLWSIGPVWEYVARSSDFSRETGDADFCEWWYNVVVRRQTIQGLTQHYESVVAKLKKLLTVLVIHFPHL